MIMLQCIERGYTMFGWLLAGAAAIGGYFWWDKTHKKGEQKPTPALPPNARPAEPKAPAPGVPAPGTNVIPVVPGVPVPKDLPQIPVSYARVSTNDPAPSGDLYIVPKPGAAGIPGVGAEKNGIVEVLEWNATPDGVWSKIAWGGGSRLKAVTGYAKRKYLMPIPKNELMLK